MFLNWHSCTIILSDKGTQISIDTDSWKKAIDILKSYGVSRITFLGWKNQIEILNHCISKNIFPSIEVSAEELNNRFLKYVGVVPFLNVVVKPKKLKTVTANLSLNERVNVILTIDGSNFEDIISALEQAKNIDRINKVSIRVLNYTEAKYSSFWKDRVFEKKRKLTLDDRAKLREIVRKIKKSKKKYKIANSDKYLDMISYYGITQNWRCRYWDSPVIAPDGCLMACRDRFLVKPLSIFDLNDRESKKKLMSVFIETSRSCPGCFQEDKIESEIRIRSRKI